MKRTSFIFIATCFFIVLAFIGCKVTVSLHEHEWSQGEVVTPAACETQGTLEKTRAGCNQKQTSAIPATGHSFGDYVSDKNATTEKDGTKTRTCSVCKKTETVTDAGTKLPVVKAACYTGDYTNTFLYPALAEGWYRCAVYQSSESIYPVGTALEILCGDKKINVIVSECIKSDDDPNPDQYVLKLDENAFEKLGDKSLGNLSVNIKIVAYNSENKLKLVFGDGLNAWYIKFSIRNTPYPVESVTVSSSNITATPATRVSSLNVFELSGETFSNPLTFTATDIHGNTITLENIAVPYSGMEQEFDVNFPL